MNSFLEKLKKGMGIEEPLEKTEKEKIEEPKKAEAPVQKTERKETEKWKTKKGKEAEVKFRKIEIEIEEKKKIPVQKESSAEIKEKVSPQPGFTLQGLSEERGELTVDVYQTETELVIQSAIAGVKPEDLDIVIEKDLLSIRGKRDKISQKDMSDYLIQECYWGNFSREIILPVEVDSGRAEAKMEQGILTIRIPKILRDKKKKIEVK